MSLDIDFELRKILSQYLPTVGVNGEPPVPPLLRESIEYSLLAPGKRIRPRLLLASAQMLGLPFESALPPALALEMIHCFTLIHDDLPCMDDDDMRRGMPSNHIKFGEDVALLAGDSLIPLATEVFLSSKSDNILHALRRFLWACGPRGVIGGQVAEKYIDSHSSLNDLRQMHRQKTGALFAAALLIPKDLAGIRDESTEGNALIRFADELGLAFQVMDDLQDRKQDQIANSDQIKPLNILSHLSESQIRKETEQGLNESTAQLLQYWGERAVPLIRIAKEIL